MTPLGEGNNTENQSNSSYNEHGAETSLVTVMNTIRSTWFGWGVLGIAGGGSYYFAKRSINADRAARHDAEMEKQARLRRLERFDSDTPKPKKPKAKPASVPGGTNVAGATSDSTPNGNVLDHAGNPSSEASEEEAPVGHAPINAEERLKTRSKYEAAEPYRSKKGDRFS